MADRLAPGLDTLAVADLATTILPPSFLISLKQLAKPLQIHYAVQFQSLTGLRAGQMTLVTAGHLATPGRMIVPPFKKMLQTTVLNIEAVPKWLVTAFKSFAINDYTPILPWTTADYRSRFRQLTKDFGLPQASHSARHTFCSVHCFLGDPLPIISHQMVHKTEKTLKAYSHELTHLEQMVVLQHPDYFCKIKLQ